MTLYLTYEELTRILSWAHTEDLEYGMDPFDQQVQAKLEEAQANAPYADER